MKTTIFLLIFSMLFILTISASENSQGAISGKDSLIIIFKGPTLQMRNIMEEQNSTISNLQKSPMNEYKNGLMDFEAKNRFSLPECNFAFENLNMQSNGIMNYRKNLKM